MKRTSISVVALFLALAANATPLSGDNALLVEVQRNGGTYLLNARFDTSLSQCAAYLYLTDYESATKLPGILDSKAYRESDNTVKVERTAEERVLFMRIHLHSVMEFTEYPNNKLTFTQLSGDSKSFSGHWLIEPTLSGSTLRFEGRWEPDTLLPLFIIDHFAKHDLEKRFGEIARLAEEQNAELSGKCPQATRLATR
ncbi:SRPBCC family protein [Sideroxydans sp.]